MWHGGRCNAAIITIIIILRMCTFCTGLMSRERCVSRAVCLLAVCALVCVCVCAALEGRAGGAERGRESETGHTQRSQGYGAVLLH